MRRGSSTGSGRHSGRSGHAKHSQNAHDTLQYNRSTYQRPTTRCSSPSDNASTARSRAQFPKLFPPVDTRESSEKLCRSIAQQSCPTVATIPRPPLSSRTSSNPPSCGTTTTIIDDRQRRLDIARGPVIAAKARETVLDFAPLALLHIDSTNSVFPACPYRGLCATTSAYLYSL